MPYKPQSIGGGGPLKPMAKIVLGVIVCVAVGGYAAFAIYTIWFDQL